MKARLKRALPPGVLRFVARLRRWSAARRDAGRTAAEVFGDIYRTNRWGGSPGEFCSGDGSSDAAVVEPYVALMRAYLGGFPADARPRVVDVGCGDFAVGRRLVDLCGGYVGVDVVPELVAHLTAGNTDPKIRFVCADASRDPLPAGDVCFVRQVFQHLSNAQIAAVLPKLAAFRTVFVTEHHPGPGVATRPNLDKLQGADIRLYRDSGVFLDAAPFHFRGTVETVLEVPDGGDGRLYPAGVIRTVRYQPAAG